jgi:hypothetical protein
MQVELLNRLYVTIRHITCPPIWGLIIQRSPTMSAADWEDLKEEICTELLIVKENGEAELETMARIVWVERQKYFTVPIAEQLQLFFEAALEAVDKPVSSPVDRERGADSGKGKLLKWKTRPCLIGAYISPYPLNPSVRPATAPQP